MIFNSDVQSLYMRLKNFLLVVEDIDRSAEFYKELFGLIVLADFDGNMVLTNGLALQQRSVWERLIKSEVSMGSNNAELYFEENNFDIFLEKLENSRFDIKYLNRPMQHDWGQRVVRFYDPDMHLIEVGESMDYVALRFLRSGMSVEETAKKTQMPESHIRNIWEVMAEQAEDEQG